MSRTCCLSTLALFPSSFFFLSYSNCRGERRGPGEESEREVAGTGEQWSDWSGTVQGNIASQPESPGLNPAWTFLHVSPHTKYIGLVKGQLGLTWTLFSDHVGSKGLMRTIYLIWTCYLVHFIITAPKDYMPVAVTLDMNSGSEDNKCNLLSEVRVSQRRE